MPSPRERLYGAFEFFARPPSKFVTKQFFDLKIEGFDNVPTSGAVVLAANHFSHLDPPLIGIHTGRYVRFMAVDQLFGKSIVFDAMMNFAGAIPLDRDGYPVAAMREAIEHLDGGNIVGLFPEGRRVERWGVDDPKRGAAWLAWMTGAPLIPVAIHGTQHSMTPGDIGFHQPCLG
jgi:1-acyl-sn-glycerol-3-phosphate acyltransferase